MDTGISHRRLSERGFTSLQFLIASSLALVVFAVLANMVVVQYSRGAMRSALDQGARAGSIAGTEEACEDRVSQVLAELLGGSIGESASFDCLVAGPVIRATGELVVSSWTPFTADFDLQLSAEASLENDES
ncbi:hypothetical protein BH23ACT4_BH23ACT4_06560 [soil metagenome]